MLRLLAGTGAVSTFLAVPLIVLLTVAGAGGKTLACLESSAGGPLAPDAPVPGGLDLVLAVTDHIAGMTDRFAQNTYFNVFMPRSWA